MKHLDLSTSVNSIKSNAFNNVYSLDYVYIPYAVSTLDLASNAFRDCREDGQEPLKVFLNIEKKTAHQGGVVLDVKDVWTSGEKEISKIRGISFDVKAGEIVGIAGIDGNGQSELIEAIAGLRKVEKGNVILDGVDITNKTVKIHKIFFIK